MAFCVNKTTVGSGTNCQVQDCHSQLFARVEGASINLSVKFSAEVIQGAIITERTPLHVHTHATLVTIHQLQVPHLLHVARVGARPCKTHQFVYIEDSCKFCMLHANVCCILKEHPVISPSLKMFYTNNLKK